MRRSLLGCVVLAFAVGPGSASVVANTLSETYDQAFANPKEFETYLLFEMNDDSFFERFAGCARKADPVLLRLEENLREQHRNCDENKECTSVAKNIQVVMEARGNVRALADYIARMAGENGPDFASTEAGKRSLGPFEIMKKALGISDRQATALIRETPAYVGVIAVLKAVPCQ